MKEINVDIFPNLMLNFLKKKNEFLAEKSKHKMQSYARICSIMQIHIFTR